MNSLTIYHGTSTPIKVKGKHQVKLLDFAYRFKHKGWHSYSTDKTTKNTVDALVKKGYLIINEHNQFKFIYPSTK